MIDTVQVHLTNENIKTIGDYIKDYSFLITLIVGALLGFGVSKFNEHLNFKKTRRFFFHALNDLKIAIEHQLKLYKSYLENLDSGNNHLENLQVNVGFNLKNINVVSKEIIYKIFVFKAVKGDKENLNRFSALNIGFNLIQHQNDIDELQDAKIRDINNTHLYEYSEARKKLVKDIDLFISSQMEVDDQDYIAFVGTYNNITNSYYRGLNDNNASIFYDKDNFLKPLFDIVQLYEYIDFIHQISAMFHTVKQLQNNRNDAIKKIKEESDRIEVAYKNIVDTLDVYSEYIVNG